MSHGIEAFRNEVLKEHQAAFDYHHEVAGVFESAIGKFRSHPTIVHLVLDMFMLQCYKTHAAVTLLAQHGLMEDTATSARRLLELSVQTAFIGAEQDTSEQERRAGRYIAFMWRCLPRTVKHRLPAAIRNQWTGVARSFGRFVPKKAKTWGPNWREMFSEVGAEKLYHTDYQWLSGIAHGRYEGQVFIYSSEPIRAHTHEPASILLVSSTKYYLYAAEQWNRVFGLVAEDTFRELVDRGIGWRFPKRGVAQ